MSGLPPGLWVFPGTSHHGQGGPGGESDNNYEHVQSVPAEEWIVIHNLDKYPSVTVLTEDGTEVWCAVRHDSKQQITLGFNEVFAGRAVCN